ncbi:MAG TPA: hypothetical protein VJZ32_09610 [Candidatus Bathyarchaeia archaeon]|nr:hypothetical protein [Candidatus Bathyarchaeia archaeon]
MAEKSRLEKALYATKEWVMGDRDLPTDTRPTIARWEKLATSQANHWMTAIRLHDSGDYLAAWPNYVSDAKEHESAGQYAKATLSLILAAECLTLIGQTSLSNEMLRSAKQCYIKMDPSNDKIDAIKEIEIALGKINSKSAHKTRLEYVQ